MSKNTPKDSVSSLLKKELGGKKLATVNEDKTRNTGGNISFDKILKIAKEKEKKTYGNMKAIVKQVVGTCVSCGVTIDGKEPKEIIKEIDEGKLQVK